MKRRERRAWCLLFGWCFAKRERPNSTASRLMDRRTCQVCPRPGLPWALFRNRFAVKQSRAGLLGLLCLVLFASSASRTLAQVTFNKDIAPIIFQHCSNCHRPGQAGPFPLLSYTDVKKRARQIVEVTGRRYMPPWLPDGPKNEFLGDRRLSETQVQRFAQWFQEGTPEGRPEELPPRPEWVDGWQLGQPDLVVKMSRKYTLAADGRDVYRNFVIPVSLPASHYVRAVELQPDNRRIVHHAFIKVDSTGQVRKMDGADGQPGFGGMNLPDGVETPSGCFLSWQPGKLPSAEPPGYGWTIHPGQDLVLQVHLKPTGKPEDLQAQIGIYFTDIPPTNATMVFTLCSFNIAIPPGERAYPLEDNLTLPVDVDVIAVLPHTHYLGKTLEGRAVFPGGAQQRLLYIPDWDFNWQGDYRYSRPVHLPAGTILQMRYLYDNSTANARNPNNPPKEVLYGPQSLDEMGELWFQVRAGSTNDLSRLAQACNENHNRAFASYAEFRLGRNPHNARARTELGFTQWSHGEISNAVQNFRTAAQDEPTYDQPHYYLGVIYRTQKRLPEARAEFELAIKLNPNNSKAFGNLAFVFVGLGDLPAAEHNFREALRLNPADDLARNTLQSIAQARAGKSGTKP